MTRNGVVVRRAGRGDVHAVATLWAHAGLPPSVRGFRREIARLRHRDPELLLIALRDGRLVGAIGGSYDGRTAVLSRLAVVVAARRQGIARLLVDAFCDQLRGLGAREDRFLVVDDAPDTRTFWNRMGFDQDGTATYLVRRGSDRPYPAPDPHDP